MSARNDQQRAKHLYEVDKLSLRDIGRRLGLSHEGARRLLLAAGVTLRPKYPGYVPPPKPAGLAPPPAAAKLPVAPVKPAAPKRPASPPRRIERAPLAELPTVRPVPAAQRKPRSLLPVQPEPLPADRVKPVTSDMVRWTRAYVARGVTVAYMARLFGVPADNLQRALSPEARAA